MAIPVSLRRTKRLGQGSWRSLSRPKKTRFSDSQKVASRTAPAGSLNDRADKRSRNAPSCRPLLENGWDSGWTAHGMCLPLWYFASCVLNVIQAANKSHSMEYGVASKTRSVGSRSIKCIRVEIRQTHENPGKNQSQTELRNIIGRCFGGILNLGFMGSLPCAQNLHSKIESEQVPTHEASL